MELSRAGLELKVFDVDAAAAAAAAELLASRQVVGFCTVGEAAVETAEGALGIWGLEEELGRALLVSRDEEEEEDDDV